MSALAAIGWLLLLAVVVVAGQFLLGVLGVWAAFFPFSEAEGRFNQDYETRGPHSDEQMILEYFSDTNVDPQIPIRLRRIFGRQFELDSKRLRPNDDFAAIYADLDLVELIVEVEEEFNVTISTNECMAIKGTISALSELVQRKLKPAGGSNA